MTKSIVSKRSVPAALAVLVTIFLLATAQSAMAALATDLQLMINRTTGAAWLQVGISDVKLAGYEIDKTDDHLNPLSWTPIAPSNGFQILAQNPFSLSEGSLGSYVTLLANSTLQLGLIFQPAYLPAEPTPIPNLSWFWIDDEGVVQPDGTPLAGPIPEPASLAIWAVLGLAGLGLVRRRGRGSN
jgi:MYXO-CTERM domain-containing protein